MTVKDLITKLLEENMDAKVLVSIDKVHYNEHGRCEGYSFNIDSVNYEYGACMIKFKDQCEVLERGPICKFRSPTNCDFCAFHSDCDEYWKEGDNNDSDGRLSGTS